MADGFERLRIRDKVWLTIAAKDFYFDVVAGSSAAQ
jgi:hypothetical protein